MAEKLSIEEYESQLDERSSSISDTMYADDVYGFIDLYENYAATGKAKKKYLDLSLKMLKSLIDDYEDDTAMVILGKWHLAGVIVEQDFKKAFDLFENATEFGNTKAFVNLGIINYFGLVSPEDMEEAYKCFVPASIKDDPEAIYLLADMYLNGDYIEQDENTAFDLYNKAERLVSKESMEAKLKLPTAEIYYRLAKCYTDEIGAFADYQNAIYYASMAQAYAFARNGANVLFADTFKKNIEELIERIKKEL